MGWSVESPAAEMRLRMANKYNDEGYYSPTEYEAFTRIEKAEKAAAKAAPSYCVHLFALLRRYGEEHRERQEIQPLCR